MTEEEAKGALKFEVTTKVTEKDAATGDEKEVTKWVDKDGKLVDKKVELTIGDGFVTYDKEGAAEGELNYKKTFDNLPEGTYTVTETNTDVVGYNFLEEASKITKDVEVKDGVTSESESVGTADLVDEYEKYTAEGSIVFSGTKFITGRNFKSGDSATFRIEAITEGAPMPEKPTVTVNPTNGSSVEFAFGEIKYTLADVGKTYTYKFTEASYNMDGVAQKDGTVYTVSTTIGDNGDGTLSVPKADQASELNFTNKSITTLRIKKVLSTDTGSLESYNGKEFYVTIKNGSKYLNDKYELVATPFRFVVKANKPLVLQNLPAGTYEIAEIKSSQDVAISGYKWNRVTGEGKITVSAGTSKETTLVNYYTKNSTNSGSGNSSSSGGGGTSSSSGGSSSRTTTTSTSTSSSTSTTSDGSVLGAARNAAGQVLGAARGVVQTGDESGMLMFGGIAAAALVGLGIWLIVFKRRKEDEDAEETNKTAA